MAQSEPFDQHFDNLVEEALAKWHVPGISFAVVDQTISHFKSYGLATLDKQTPADENTLYYAASTTKAQLCAVWGLYIASPTNQTKPPPKRITWRTRMLDIIGDDFYLSDSMRTQTVTLEDALSHRTGLPRHDLTRGYAPMTTPKAVTRNMSHLPLHNDLRTDFEYCNLMFTVASHALENVTGKSLATVLREWLWEPLGMASTFAGILEANEAVKEHGSVLATCYTWSRSSPEQGGDVRSLTEEAHVDLSPASGAGYVISTASDYAKWMQALVGSSTSSPVSRDLLRELWTPRTLVHHPSRKVPVHGIVAYALGWFAGEYRGRMAYWHSGGVTGAGSFILVVPDLQWGVTFFANGQDVSSSIKGLVFELLDARLGVPVEERRAFEECEKMYENGLREGREAYAGALTTLFPGGSIDSSHSGAKQVEQYAGTYRHPNYGQIVLRSAKDKTGQSYLQCRMDDRTWLVTFEFHPVITTSSESSGDWFLVTLYDPADLFRKAMQARGRKNIRGEVEVLDIAIETTMPTTLIPFDRVDGVTTNGSP